MMILMKNFKIWKHKMKKYWCLSLLFFFLIDIGGHFEDVILIVINHNCHYIQGYLLEIQFFFIIYVIMKMLFSL